VSQWELSEDVKTIVKAAENRFDIYMKEHCGINSQLMMPGNYARTFFSTSHDILLNLIADVDRRENLSIVLKTSKVDISMSGINPFLDRIHI
jgi:hypothetical protein